MVKIDHDQLREVMNDLVQTDGWKLVETHINGRISHFKTQLMHCKLEEVEALRERVKTLESVLYYVKEQNQDITAI